MSARNCQLFVTKLPRDTTRDDVKDMFRTFGKIREITLKKGYGFVEFYDRHDADDAIHRMNGEKVDGGTRLVVERAGEKRSRRESRGPQREDKCFNCGDRGHWANECKRSSRGRRRRYSSSRSSSSNDRRKYRHKKRGEKRRRSSSDSNSRKSSSSSRSGGSSKSRSRSREMGEKHKVEKVETDKPAPVDEPKVDEPKVDEDKKSDVPQNDDVGVDVGKQAEDARSKSSASRSKSRSASKRSGRSSKSSQRSKSN